MADAIYDALIVGGGPGGSTAAYYLAKAGRSVLLLEKDRFPRFHIGESLLPYNRTIFEEMGLQEKLAQAGFPKKTGAQFHLGNGSKSLLFSFRTGRYTRENEAIQVERSTFDHILLEHARGSGVEVLEEHTVTRATTRPDGAQVEATDHSGRKKHFNARFLIDASGRSNLTGNQEGLRMVHPHLKKVAIFGHFAGVRLDEGERKGDTVIIRMENKWFWLIPLAEDKVSIGCVMDQEELGRAGRTPEELFHNFWRKSAPLRERMGQARLLGNLQVTSDFSYRNRRLVGPRLLRVGDAAAFMDPIFSAGVYLAMYSGKLAARTVHAALQAGDDGGRQLNAYEKRFVRAMKQYWEMVERFYTTPFMEIFMEPREKMNLPAAVNAVLAGELDGGWRLRWRLRVFFWIVKLQARWPLVPRITFDEADSKATTPE